MNELIQTVKELRDGLVFYAFDHNDDDLFDVACDLTLWLAKKRGDSVDFTG